MGVVLWNCSHQYGESGMISWRNFASVPKKSPNFTPEQWVARSISRTWKYAVFKVSFSYLRSHMKHYSSQSACLSSSSHVYYYSIVAAYSSLSFENTEHSHNIATQLHVMSSQDRDLVKRYVSSDAWRWLQSFCASEMIFILWKNTRL